jgi:Domain of unknown function (DUF4410)
MRISLFVRSLFIAGLLTFGGGCSHSLTPASTVQAPDRPPTALAIGRITDDNPDQERFVRGYRRLLIAALEDSEAFPLVVSPAPSVLPSGAALLTGHFSRVSEGSETLRWLVGLGAGSPSLRARFEIHDAAGRRLAAFDQTARSFDGTGYAAHWNPVSTDDMAALFAVDTAAAVVAWSRGATLD